MLPVTLARRFGFPLASRWGFDPFEELGRVADSLLGECDSCDVRVDVREDEENFYVDADLPGFARDQIEVTCESDVLTISGERKCQDTRQGESFRITERRSGRFSRSFRLSDRVNQNSVEAQLKDGVLTVRIAKADDVKPRKIEVKGS